MGSSEIILSSENEFTLITAAERHDLLHLSSSQEEADTKLILHADKVLKEGSSKVAIHSLSGDY